MGQFQLSPNVLILNFACVMGCTHQTQSRVLYQKYPFCCLIQLIKLHKYPQNGRLTWVTNSVRFRFQFLQAYLS